jgi:predicted transcriptional regulator
MIRFCNNIKDSINASVIGVYGFTSCRQDLTFTLLALKMASLAKGAGILLSTLFKLNGNRPLVVKLALIFFSVNALSLIRLYKVVKCSLLIVFTPPYSSQLT